MAMMATADPRASRSSPGTGHAEVHFPWLRRLRMAFPFWSNPRPFRVNGKIPGPEPPKLLHEVTCLKSCNRLYVGIHS